MKKSEYIKTYRWMNVLRGGAIRDVYALLYQLGQKEDVKVTISYICERLGYSDRSIQKSINELKEKGLLEVKYTDGKSSIFSCNTPEESSPLTPEESSPLCDTKNNSSDPRRIFTPNPRRIFTPEESSPPKNLHPTPEESSPPTPYLLSLDKNLDKNYSSSSSVGTSARERLQKWFEESDLKEWVLRLEKSHGITIETTTILNDFFDNDFQVRENCDRWERMSVLKHFQNWLPKYLRILKEQNNQPSTINSQSNGNIKSNRNGGISPQDFAATFAAGFVSGGGRIK